MLYLIIYQLKYHLIHFWTEVFKLQFTQYPKPPKNMGSESTPYEKYTTILTNLNMALTCLFFVEATLKIFAFGPKVAINFFAAINWFH